MIRRWSVPDGLPKSRNVALASGQGMLSRKCDQQAGCFRGFAKFETSGIGGVSAGRARFQKKV